MFSDVRIVTWDAKWKQKEDRCRRTKKTTDKKSVKKISKENKGSITQRINEKLTEQR